MKFPVDRHARVAGSRAARVAEAQMQAALRTRLLQAPDLFSDRDENAAEYASILQDFERLRNEATDADRFN
ncbi:MAG TPA: hypothetical protein VFO67_06975 [Gemmatimonadales bacterium]|nr:hypothetical protein [Gemmatimonadales bacterium]